MSPPSRVPRRRAGPVLAAVAVLASALSACADDGRRSAGPAVVSPVRTVGAAATTSRAAELEAGLTAVLLERVHARAAAADEPGAAWGPVLDATSVALADVLSSGFADVRGPLLSALRACDDALLARSAADSDDDAAAAAAPPACREDLERAVRRAVPRLSDEQVQGRLLPVAPPPGADAATALRAAGADARGTARVFAGAVAADRRLGPVPTPASTLRADLTWLLVEHVALAVAAADPAAAPGVRAALTGNGADLAERIGEAYPAARTPFARTWNAHLDRLGSWTASLHRTDAARTGTLRAAVLGLSGDLGPVLAGHVAGLPAERLDQELRPALLSLLAAVDAAALDRPDAPAEQRRAVADIVVPAALVAAAVAEDQSLT